MRTRVVLGILLVCLGSLFLALGALTMFNATLLSVGHVLLLAGIPLTNGCSNTLCCVGRGRCLGVIVWCLGVVFVVMRWPVVGILVEVVGIAEILGLRG